VTVRLPPDQLAALDAWITTNPDAPTRAEAIRRIVAAHLMAGGLSDDSNKRDSRDG
jgi:anti-sigma factor RsiW